MRVKDYRDTAHWMKKDWVRYGKRNIMLDRAADLLGFPSYPMFVGYRGYIPSYLVGKNRDKVEQYLNTYGYSFKYVRREREIEYE